MWRTLVALVLFVTPALAQERVTAYDALRVVGIHINRDAVNHVVSVTGAKGDPQPETWNILLDDRAHGGIREIQVRNGRVTQRGVAGAEVVDGEGHAHLAKGLERRDDGLGVVHHDALGDLQHEGPGIEPAAAKHAGHVAHECRQLAARDVDADADIVGHQARAPPAGKRLQRGAQDVQTEREVPRDVRSENPDEENGEEHGPFHGVRQRLRPYFQRAQDEANGMFDRVRRSFSDYINR